jgi:1-acyl-sn-glycerol-3-phosphate acyltransferase
MTQATKERSRREIDRGGRTEPAARAASVEAPNKKKNQTVLARLWYAVLWSPCWAISQVYFRYRYSGRGNVPPTGPVLLVANHQSHLDPVLVGIACPRQLKYLARQGLFFWPFSLWIRSLGAVPIDRERGAIGGIKTTLRLLSEEHAVVVFPEGSRTPDGRLHPLLAGFCLLARRSGATIVPVAIDGAYKSMPRGSYFPLPAPIGLVFGPAIRKEEFDGWSDSQLIEVVSKRIAAGLEQLKRHT